MQISVARMTEALDADINLIVEIVQIRHHLIDAASRNNHIDLIHVSRGSLDCLQESASGFPDGFLTLLGIGNQHVQCALFQAEFGHLVIRFFDLLGGITIKFQKQIRIRLFIRERFS